jgi:endonuclease YncB( thermonuclease family)
VGAERLTLALLLVTALATGCRSEEAEPPSPPESAVVARVNDGDTLTLRDGARVRLVQIDAPELFDECYGHAASQALLALAPPGSRITLSGDEALDDRDQHGRLLRYVTVGDTNVNVELVRRGAASPYFFRNDRGRHADELLDAVDEARTARRGYWSACPGAELDPVLGAITGPA